MAEYVTLDTYLDDRTELILTRAFSMEQYNSTADARNAIKLILKEVYHAGKVDGIVPVEAIDWVRMREVLKSSPKPLN